VSLIVINDSFFMYHIVVGLRSDSSRKQFRDRLMDCTLLESRDLLSKIFISIPSCATKIGLQGFQVCWLVFQHSPAIDGIQSALNP
jgi:hypothetical protein